MLTFFRLLTTPRLYWVYMTQGGREGAADDRQEVQLVSAQTNLAILVDAAIPFFLFHSPSSSSCL